MRSEDHVDHMLDQALEMTFPASDPISIFVPETAEEREVNDEESSSRACPPGIEVPGPDS